MANTRQCVKISEGNAQFVVIKNETAEWNPYYVYKKEWRWENNQPHRSKRIVARLETLKDCLEWIAEWGC